MGPRRPLLHARRRPRSITQQRVHDLRLEVAGCRATARALDTKLAGVAGGAALTEPLRVLERALANLAGCLRDFDRDA